MLRQLPVDIADFRELRQLDYLYVDKTEYAFKLITQGRRYFLARPRRFGKSLFVSTLKAILLGERALFTDLWIAQNQYDWLPHAVIHLDLSGLGIADEPSFKLGLCSALAEVVDEYELGLTIDFTSPELALRRIVKALNKRYGRVAILIDEYDAPILRLLSQPALAITVRDHLRSFFAAIKGLDADLNFVFITGVTTFSKAGLFSGLNNLQQLTLNEKFSAVCGYTEAEIATYFSSYLAQWSGTSGLTTAALRTQLQTWYNGYQFSLKGPSLYNPFSFMHALHRQQIDNFWLETGSPTFLIDELQKETRQSELQLFNPEALEASKHTLGVFDIGLAPLPTLLFQTGYLTLAGYDQQTELYSFKYPNLEVKTTLEYYLLGMMAGMDYDPAGKIAKQLRAALAHCNLEVALALIQQLFANIAYREHLVDEKFYHGLLQMACKVAGIKSQSEYATSHGSIDLVLTLPDVVYIVELKLNQTAEAALEQILTKRYYEPLIGAAPTLILWGLNFNKSAGQFMISQAYQKLIAVDLA